MAQPCAQGVCGYGMRSELNTFKVISKRWMAERSFAWLEKNRWLWKKCEWLLNTSLQSLHLVFLVCRYSKDFVNKLLDYV